MDYPIGSRAQGYAVAIEHILCNIFDCERYGFGGIVNSDFIRKQPFTAISCGLSFFAATEGKRDSVEKYIDKYYYYSEMSLDTLLSFTTSTKVIDRFTIEIDFKDGEEAVETMIDDFRKVIYQ